MRVMEEWVDRYSAGRAILSSNTLGRGLDLW